MEAGTITRSMVIKRIYIFFLILLPLAMVVILAAQNLTDGNGVYYCADQSELLRTSRRLLNGIVVNHGPPSRHGMYHPGPLFYYFLALLTFLSAGNYILLKLAYASTFIAGFLAYVYAQRRMVGRDFVPFFPFAAALAFYFHPLGAHYINSVWGPSILLVIMPLLLLVEILVLEGRWMLLPAWTLLASFAIQTHYGTGPLVISMGLVVLAFLPFDIRRHRERRGDFLRAIRRSAGLFLFVWTPTIIEIVHRKGENVRIFYTKLFANNPGQRTDEVLNTFHFMLRDVTGFDASIYIFWATFPLLAAILIWKPDLRRSAGRWVAVYAAVLAGAWYSFSHDPEPVLYYYVYYYNLFFLAEMGFAFTLVVSAIARGTVVRYAMDLLMVSLLAFTIAPRILTDLHRYSNTAWNPCPYGEMRRVAEILKIQSPRRPIRVKLTGSETENMTVPLLRIFEDEGIRLSWTAANVFIITSPIPPGARGIFVGERILLTKEDSRSK